jgi:tight adherence protein B
VKRRIALLLVVLLAAGSPAYADSVISTATVSHSELSLVLSVPAASRAGLQVTVDGAPVVASVQLTRAVPDRSVMLLLDESGSMQGEPIREAVTAARTFSAAVPAAVRVGLLGFGDRPRLLLDPTTDRRRLEVALHAVRAGGNTTLYDAVQVALRHLPGTGTRSLVLLTDGQDTSSGSNLAVTSAALVRSGVQLHVISLSRLGAAPVPLKQLAAAGHGSVDGVRSASRLPAAFRSAADKLRDAVRVTAALPASSAGKQVTVAVSFRAGATTVHDEVVVLVPARASLSTPASTTARAPSSEARPSLLVAAALLFLGLFGAAHSLATSPAADRRRRTALLSAYTVRPATSAKAEDTAPGFLLRVAEAWGRRGDRTALAAKLEKAGLEMTPGEWLVRQIAVGLTLTVLVTLLVNLVVGVVAGLLVSLAGFRFVLSVKAKRRLAKFQADLPDSLQLVASSLSAGYSLPQALDAVVQEGSQPLAGEFGRALAEARLGVPVEDALDVVATRVGSEDFRWVVLSIRIQRSTGGNLSEVLLTVCKTMRERAAMRRQVKALSAEGRLSAYLLIGLPIALALFEFSFRRPYMRPLYTSGMGMVMLVMACIGIVVGALWMRKIINVSD